MKEFTSIHFFPFSDERIVTNVVTLQRQDFQERPSQLGYLFGASGTEYQYVAANEKDFKQEVFLEHHLKPTVKGVIEFSVSSDLLLEVENT